MRVPRPVKWSVAVLVLTPPAFFAGLALSGLSRLALPLLPTIVLYPAYFLLVLKNRLKEAVMLVLGWALVLTLLMIWATISFGEELGHVVIRGPEYRDEMFHWILTGEGPEGDPRLFIAPKIREIAVFSLASFATLGFAGLLMGAILLNYMNYYVGALILHAAPGSEVIVAILAWPIYAIIRVPGYVCLGVALSRLSLNLVRERRLKFGEVRRLIHIAALLIAMDFLLKGTIANALYQPLLKAHTRI